MVSGGHNEGSIVAQGAQADAAEAPVEVVAVPAGQSRGAGDDAGQYALRGQRMGVTVAKGQKEPAGHGAGAPEEQK